jgi:hypothetical protein
MAGERPGRADRIARMVQWAESKGPTGPDPSDVRMVAALGIDQIGALGQLLLTNYRALSDHWRELQMVGAGEPPEAVGSDPRQDPTHPMAGRRAVSDEDPVRVSPVYPTVYPMAVEVPQAVITPASDLAVLAREGGERRHARLIEWRSEALAERPELEAISSEDLRRLAFSDAINAGDVAQFSLRTTTRSLFEALAGELADVLRGVSDNAAGDSASVEQLTQPSTSPPDETLRGDLDEARPASAFMDSVGYFAAFDWGQVVDGAPDVPTMLVIPEGDMFRLAWPSVDGPEAAIYRVVESVDTWAASSPDTGVTLGATHTPEVLTPLAPRSSATYLAVWANQGKDEIAARNAQPTLVATGEIVWPPETFSVSVTPVGEVVARFKTQPGAVVEVQKFRADEPIRYDQSKSLRGGLSEDGFVDKDPLPGVSLTYAVFSVVVLGGKKTVVSEPKTATVKVVREPHSISLRVDPDPTTSHTYDLSWVAPPFGTVDVYLTSQQPPSGLGDQSRTLEVIEMQGLTSERRLNYPVHKVGDTRVIKGVTLERAWVKGFFVAVHVVAEEAVRVGPMQTTVNATPPGEPQIVERVDTQIVTFAWPEDVRMVEVFQGPISEHDLDPTQADVIATLTEDEYVERGGLRLAAPLPSNGCALYLFGVVYDHGAPTRSRPVRVEYGGIARLRYRVEAARRDGSPVGQNSPPDVYRILLQTDEPMPPTPMCLVSNGSRLPLHPQDQDQQGLPVMTWSDVSPAPGAPVTLCEIPVGSRRLFIRLFVNYPPKMCGGVALLDPPLAQLKVIV